MKRRVVVTGLGIVSCLGCTADELWRRLLAGESGIHLLSILDTSTFKVKIGGDIQDWSPEGYIERKEVKRLDRVAQFALVAATDAVRDSGIDFSKEDPYRCGVIMGSGVGGLGETESQVIRMTLKGSDRVSALTVPKMMVNAAGGQVGIRFGLRGPNYSIATACASATNAMGEAYRAIQDGRVDVLITGGCEAAITSIGVSSFQNMRALSVRNDAPAEASRPFDLDRDGFVLSEGAGILVFEEYEHAKARGAHIHGELVGYGESCDAGHITAPDVTGVGAARAMQDAIRRAQIDPQAIDYINAHATSTMLGDKAETAAIKKVLGAASSQVAISSTKSQLGHSLGASGGIEFAICLMAMRNNVVPPTINLHTPDPDCDLDYTPNQPRERQIDVVMSNSFGFGGHNACVVARRL